MTKVIISKKQILNIQEFMANYIGKVYDKEKKLTHNEMYEYLMEKGIPIPKRANYDYVDKESLLKGTYLIVKDETSQIIIYKNPRMDLEVLLEQLQVQNNFKEKILLKK